MSYFIEVSFPILDGQAPNLRGNHFHKLADDSKCHVIYFGETDYTQSIHEIERTFWQGLYIQVQRNNGTVTVWSDPIGSLPVYYMWNKYIQKLIVTDEPEFLINNILKKTEPDAVAFWQALAFETPFRNRTILNNVSQLGSGEKLELSDGGVAISRYWKWDYENKYASLSFEKCVDLACEMFENASRKAVKNIDVDQILLPLSGGPDSRLAAILASKHININRLLPITYAYSTISREVSVAKKVSQELSLRGHEFYKLTPEIYAASLSWMPLETGGLVSFANVHLLDYLRKGYENKGIYSSAFSDALCGYEAESKIKAPYKTWMSSKHVNAWREVVKDYNVSKDIDDETMSDLEQLSMAWADSTITTFEEYLYIVERHAKFHLPLVNLWSRYAKVITPFVSGELLELFFGMPPEYRINKKLEHAVIERLNPKVARIESMSSLVLSGRTGGKMDRYLNRGINLANVLLRGIQLGGLEVPSPRVTEQLCKALHTSLKEEYAISVDYLEMLGLYQDSQRSRIEKPALRVGKRLGAQLTALNCAKVYRLKL